jgi:hypothetical protein
MTRASTKNARQTDTIVRFGSSVDILRRASEVRFTLQPDIGWRSQVLSKYGSDSLKGRSVTPTPKPKIPLTIWIMLGAVIVFALLLSYFLVIGVYDITARGLS